jgi:hypothetical protein
MNTNTAWNCEPSQRMLFEEPIIRLLMTRDGVDVATLRRLWPKATRRWQATAEQPKNRD